MENKTTKSQNASYLGRVLFYGIRRKRDYKRAFPLLLRAASENWVHSQYLAGYALANGLGTRRNIREGQYWYSRAARNGHPEAAFDLALTYGKRGTKSDLRMARFWYARAVRNGHREAPFNLALMYEFGEGVERNPRKAFMLYKEGAQRGDPEAQCNLGVAYLEGMGTTENGREAIRGIRNSPRQDDARAD